MADIKSVAVFCGAQVGVRPEFRAAAESLGQGIAQAGLQLIYGGGRIGLMGAVADAALAAGGEVLGVIPDFLRRREVAHKGVARLEVTDSMHTRKRRMFDLADVFVTMPGGLGTLDETIEIITWRQLGLHNKPVLLCDVSGSMQPMIAAIEACIDWGFAGSEIRALYEVVHGVDDLLSRLRSLSVAGNAPVNEGAGSDVL
jgi:uncharacterized protein (TIGR00730 family)